MVHFTEYPRIGRKSFDERREFILDLPKRAESRLFENFGATSESDGGRRMGVGYVDGHLSENVVDCESSMRHDGGGCNGKLLSHVAKGSFQKNSVSLRWGSHNIIPSQVRKPG